MAQNWFTVDRIPNSDSPTILETFDGKPRVATRGIMTEIPIEAVYYIVELLREEAREKGGIDYLQQFNVHSNGTTTKAWCIDDGCAITLLLPDEY